jgi:hypothetical protein
LDNISKPVWFTYTRTNLSGRPSVDVLIVRRCPPQKGGQLRIQITPIKTMNSCPFCGREFTEPYEDFEKW